MSAQPQIQKLKFVDLSFGYEDAPVLLNKIDFEFPMFKTVWIHAANGHGRSSLMQIMAGLQMPTQGKYFINDMDLTEVTFEEFLPYRLKIGYGFDFGGLLNNRTVMENLTLPIMYHKILGPAEAISRAAEYLSFLGLLRYKDQRPAVVPGGVRKLVCMIRALILHPEVLLLDDPSVGMNEETVFKFFELVRRIKAQGHLFHVFISSFDQRLMKHLGAEEVLISDGQLHMNNFGTRAA